MNKVKFIKSQAFKDFSIIILLLGTITLVFRFTNLDIRLQQYFYSTEKGWLLQYRPFWDFLYRFGIFPGYFIALGALLTISLSYWSVRYIKYRKAALLLVFTLIIGPGILVNLVLKDHTGRPRPREIVEFGGTEKYLCVCVKGENNNGKSFPCGHCSMGFYFAIPYLFLRYRHKALAYTFLVAGIIYGIIIGIARMMAGGHFASDVLWAGGIVWLIALAGFYLFKVDKPVEIPDIFEETQKKKAKLATLIIGILLPVITIGLMLATPYISKKSFNISRNELKNANYKVFNIDLKDATALISSDSSFHIEYKVNAFGFPNSKIRGNWITTGDTGSYTIKYMGWFTEIKNVVQLQIPDNDSCFYNFKIDYGKAIFALPDTSLYNIRISITKGDVFLKFNPENVCLVGDSSKIENKSSKIIKCFATRPLVTNKSVFEFELAEGIVNIE